MNDPVADLLAFLDRSPTPYHAVAEVRRRLEGAGWSGLDEGEVWRLEPGARHFVVRGDGSLLAFELGAASPAEAGFRAVGAHTDSPNLRLKPRPGAEAHGFRRLGVEPYGGVLLHSWLDRDLSLAGRVTVAGDDGPTTRLLDFERPLLRVPNLAIHLYPELRQDGLKLNAQQHLVPVVGLEEGPEWPELLALELRAKCGLDVGPEGVLGFDLMAYDTQRASVIGAQGEFLCSARLDNLASCHAGLCALLDPAGGGRVPFTRVLVLYDHEEVGSRSAQGASGTLLLHTLERIVSCAKDGANQGMARAAARSLLISVDMAHAVHPNYADRHDPAHTPRLGQGPVVKVNAGQAYASDSWTTGRFTSLCGHAGVAPQHFVTRSDLACGSTIGPISAARAGIPTVDVGSPMLAMHSCRELAGTADVAPMIDVLRHFYGGAS